MRGVDGLFLRLASDFVLSDIRWLRLSDGAQCLWLTLSAIALKERREFLPAGYEDPSELAYRRRREPEEIEGALAELLGGSNPVLGQLPDGRLRVTGVREKHGDAFKWAEEAAEAEIWNTCEGNKTLDPAAFAAIVWGKKEKKAPNKAPCKAPPAATGRPPDADSGSPGRRPDDHPTTVQRGEKIVGTTIQSSSDGESPQRQREGQRQRQRQRQGQGQPPSAPPNRRSGADGGKQVAQKRAVQPSGGSPSPPPLVPSGGDGPPGSDPPTGKHGDGGNGLKPSKLPRTVPNLARGAFTRETAQWSGDPEPAALTVKIHNRVNLLAQAGYDTAVEALAHVYDVTAGLRRKGKARRITKPWRTLEKRLGGAKGIMKSASEKGREWAKMMLDGSEPRRSKAKPQTLGEAAVSALAGMGIEAPGVDKENT